MGTWDVGPFDNDDAADFAYDLDEASIEERGKLVRDALTRAADATDHLNGLDGTLAVAMAALVAAQCPGGEPAHPHYGPSEPMPEFPSDLKILAADALDRVVAKSSELAELWDESVNGTEWRQTITRLRNVLEPSQKEALFGI